MTDTGELKLEAPLYFEDFTQSHYWNFFQKSLLRSSLDNASSWLIREVSEKEIVTAVHQMPPDKAPVLMVSMQLSFRRTGI